MTPKQLKDVWKTQAGIAAALGCKQSSVSAWFANNEVPEGKQYQAQIATLGALTADRPALRTRASA